MKNVFIFLLIALKTLFEISDIVGKKPLGRMQGTQCTPIPVWFGVSAA